MAGTLPNSVWSAVNAITQVETSTVALQLPGRLFARGTFGVGTDTESFLC